MDDAQVKKLQDEVIKLEEEHKAIEKACTSIDACKSILDYCNKTPDPFLGDNETQNPWATNAQSGGGCIIV